MTSNKSLRKCDVKVGFIAGFTSYGRQATRTLHNRAKILRSQGKTDEANVIDRCAWELVLNIDPLSKQTEGDSDQAVAEYVNDNACRL
jgi:pyridoxal biosynthesis lyase PdxS